MTDSIVWVKVRHTSFDLAGLLLSALTLVGVLVLGSALVGALLAVRLIRRRRGQSGSAAPMRTLNVVELESAAPHHQGSSSPRPE